MSIAQTTTAVGGQDALKAEFDQHFERRTEKTDRTHEIVPGTSRGGTCF